ncbi:MAG: S1C family serine protease [Bacteroidota bacterium]|nr:S1C family serine protease [Bacteroidota bacterium]
MNPILCILTIFFTLLTNNVFAQNKPDFDKIDAAVVLIQIFDSKGEFRGHGSGFFIDDKGTIATNYHVVDDAYKMSVVVQEGGIRTTYDVNSILKGDENIDLAIISIRNLTNKTFKYLKLSSKKPKKGDDCFAIGTPADRYFMNNVSKGVVSNVMSSESPKKLYTTADITHGSSGGALINSKGEVIGITTGGLSGNDGTRASLNYAIDISELSSLPEINKEQLIDPLSIPCEISFYSNSKYAKNAALYVDGNFIGTFDKYFPTGEPSCGVEGTITRSLSSGRHSYRVYYRHLKAFSETRFIDLGPGQCFLVKVGVRVPLKSSNSIVTEKPIIRPIEKFNSAIYASVAFSTPYSSNKFDGQVLSFGFEKGLSRNISLRFKFQMPKDYVSEVTSNPGFNNGQLPWNRRYSCSYDYQAFFLDFKVFDNIWQGLYNRSGLEQPGGPWWSPSISYVKLNKERVSGYDAPIQYEEETAFGFGLSVGHDLHFTQRLICSTEILWMNYRNKNILDEARFTPYSLSEESTSIGVKLSMSYRFNTLGKRMDKSLINADWIDWWL